MMLGIVRLKEDGVIQGPGHLHSLGAAAKALGADKFAVHDIRQRREFRDIDARHLQYTSLSRWACVIVTGRASGYHAQSFSVMGVQTP